MIKTLTHSHCNVVYEKNNLMDTILAVHIGWQTTGYKENQIVFAGFQLCTNIFYLYN